MLKLEELSVDQKLGMLLCARCNNPDDVENMEYTLELIRNHALGCIQPGAHRPEAMKRVQEAADYPILIINDTEMGFPTSDLPKVPLMTLAACNNEEYYRTFARGVVHDAQKAACTARGFSYGFCYHSLSFLENRQNVW